MTNAKFYLNLSDHHSFPKALPLILRIRVIKVKGNWRSKIGMPVSSRPAQTLRSLWAQTSTVCQSHTYRLVADCIISEGLEKHLNRQMDTVCYKKRVQDSISCPSQIDKGSGSVFESNTLRSFYRQK